MTQYVFTSACCGFATVCTAALVRNDTGEAIRTRSALRERESFIDGPFYHETEAANRSPDAISRDGSAADHVP